MNELPHIDEYERSERRRAAQVGAQAVEDELREPSPPVEVAIYVNGRLVNTKTDSDTVMRIMALLTGLGG